MIPELPSRTRQVELFYLFIFTHFSQLPVQFLFIEVHFFIFYNGTSTL